MSLFTDNQNIVSSETSFFSLQHYDYGLDNTVVFNSIYSWVDSGMILGFTHDGTLCHQNFS